MSNRYICLSAATSPWVANRIDGIRLRVTVTEADGMPSKIFAYQSIKMRPSTNQSVSAFDHVCSPPDLADYPEDTPLVGSQPDWFRTDFVDVLLRSEDEALRVWDLIVVDVMVLKKSLDTTDILQPFDSACIGTAPADTSSSSL